MSKLPKPPKAHDRFSKRYPKIRKAWDLLAEAGSEGPLDERTARLVKLGIAIGARGEGAVHSAVRKAVAAGASRAEIEQVVALAASTIGLPATVMAWSWTRDSSRVSEPCADARGGRGRVRSATRNAAGGTRGWHPARRFGSGGP